MLFLYAVRRLLAYNLPEESIKATVKHIVEENCIKPLQEKISKESSADGSAQLKEQLEKWKHFDYGYLMHTVSSSVSKLNIADKNDLEEFVSDAMVKLLSEHRKFFGENEHNKVHVDPATSKPGDLIALINNFVYYRVYDAARGAYGRTRLYKDEKNVDMENMTEKEKKEHDDKEKNIKFNQKRERNVQPKEDLGHGSIFDLLGGASDDASDFEIKELKEQMENYVSKRIQPSSREFWTKWLGDAERGGEHKSCHEYAKELNLSDSRISQFTAEIQKVLRQYFEKVLFEDVAMTPRMVNKLESVKICTASKLAIEEVLAKQTFRIHIAKFVLGGVYADLQSGDFKSPKDMITSIITKKH